MNTIIRLAAIATFVGIALTACGAAKLATYAGELEVCQQTSSTCAAYVACRKGVAAKYDRSYSGECVLADAGVDGAK